MKFKKKLLFYYFIILLFLLFGACSSVENQQEESLSRAETTIIKPITESVDKQLIFPAIQKIIDRGYIRVAMLPNDIGVLCRTTQDGDFAGLDVDFARDIARTLGVKLEIHKIKQYSDIALLLANGTVDLGIAMYSVNHSRAASVILSDPYLTSNLCITVNSKELIKNNIKKNPINYMKQNSVKIAVLKGSIHSYTAQEVFPKAQVIELNSQDEIINSVIENKVFAAFQGEVESVDNYIRNPKIMIFTKSFVFPDASDKFCVAIAPNDLGMLNFINAYINSSKIFDIKDIENACKELYDY